MKTGSDERTAMNDTVSVIEVSESFEHGTCDLSDDLNINGAYLLVNPIKGTLVHELHANADIWIRKKCAIERDNVWRVAIMHNVKFAENLFPYGRLCINEHDLDIM